MDTQFIQIKSENNGVSTITLNRPDKNNAFNAQMVNELESTIKKLNTNDDVRIILLQSKGDHFCAGGDLLWMQEMGKAPYEDNLRDAKQLATLFHTLYTSPKPVVALVQGPTYGGGIGLVSCSDIVITTDDATFCMSEVRLGLVAATIAPYVIASIGPHHARRYMLTAEPFSAQEAKRIELVSHVVTLDQVSPTCEMLCEKLLNNGPEALTKTKQLIQQLNPIDEKIIELSAKWLADARTSEDAQDRITAFFDRSSR